jgi:hypothetical protein
MTLHGFFNDTVNVAEPYSAGEKSFDGHLVRPI